MNAQVGLPRLRGLRWAANLTGIGEIVISQRIIVGDKGLGRPIRMWADGYGIKMDGKETGCDHVSWIELVRVRVQSWASLLVVLNVQSSPTSELVWQIVAN